jgi:Heterokaryon incompatibility protein (HET)
MSRIYGQAVLTYVWLGGHDDHVPAIDALMDLAILKRKLPDEQIASLHSVLVVDQQKNDRPELARLTRTQCMNIISFFNRSWFRRVWVVQEIAMSRNPVFICGSRMFPLNIIYYGLEFLFLSGWLEKLKVMADKHIEQLNLQTDRNFGYNPKLGVEENLADIPDSPSVPFPTTGLPESLIDRTESKDHPLPKLIQWTSDHEFDFRIIENHSDLRRTVTKKRNSPLWVVAQALRSTEAGNPRDKICALLGLAWDLKKNQSAEQSLFPD